MSFIRGRSGFSIIEILIALLIGAILILGIGTIFTTTSNNIRIQRGISQMQESGRIALQRLTDDVSQTGALHCSSLDFRPPVNGITPPRAIRLVANSTASQAAGGLINGFPSIGSVASGYASPRFMLQGHDCSSGSCTPLLNALGSATPNPPASGAVSGTRVPNADVLTIRRLSGRGAPIASVVSTNAQIRWNFPSNMLTRLGGTAGAGVAMIGTCNTAALFTASLDGSGTFATANSASNAGPGGLTAMAEAFGAQGDQDGDPRFFWGPANFLTVTYFLQNVDDRATPGRVIPALMRQVNGTAQEIARGVERLDFRYAVTNFITGNTQWMDASELQTLVTDCRPRPFNVAGACSSQVNNAAATCDLPTGDLEESGCGWRKVTAVEMGMLINTSDRVGDDEFTYTYSMEGEVEATVPAGGERMLRREFRTIVPIRNWVR